MTTPLTPKFSKEYEKQFELWHGAGSSMGFFHEVTNDAALNPVYAANPGLRQKREAAAAALAEFYEAAAAIKEDWVEGRDLADCRLLELRTAACEVNTMIFHTLSTYDKYHNHVVYEKHPELGEMEDRMTNATANFFWYAESVLGMAGPYQRLEEKYPKSEEIEETVEG